MNGHHNWYIDGEEQDLATAVMDGSVKDTSYISSFKYHSTYVDFMKANSWTPETTDSSSKHVCDRHDLNRVSGIPNDSSFNITFRII